MENQKYILVIDDSPETADLLEDFLLDNGFLVSVAGTAQEGFQSILQKKPDLILLDLFLPDMMGSDVCTQLRSSSNTRDIPIILCTSHQVTHEEKMKGFRAGVDDYLVRPFELAELLARMNAVLRRTELKPKTDLLADIQNILTESKPASGPITSVPAKPEAPSFPPLSTNPFSAKPFSGKDTPRIKKEFQPLQIIKRFWQLLNHPSEAFHTPQYNHDSFTAIVFVVLTPIIASLAKVSDKSGGFDGWIGFLSLGIVTNLMMWSATAGLLHLTLPFQGIHLSMRRSLAIAGLSWAPRLLGAAFSAVYGMMNLLGLATNPDHFTGGLDLFFPVDFSAWISFLGHIGIFDFWSAGITLCAVWIITRSTDRKWTMIPILIGVICLAFGTLTHY